MGVMRGEHFYDPKMFENFVPQFLCLQVEKGTDNLLNWGWALRSLKWKQDTSP